MSQTVGPNHNRVYRLVLCGGPCGGKTTGQARLCTFFESIGWKVFRVTACESIMASGGVKAADSRNTDKTLTKFYENMLRMKMMLEKTYFDLAAISKQDCLIICDGGTMDIKARMSTEQWNQMIADNGWNEVELRDSHYNQVVHMMSIADASTGRRRHFSSHEGMDIGTACQLDSAISQAWVGHPYYDVIDNTTNFDSKLVRMIAAVCDRLDIEYGDRLSTDSYKRKFLVTRMPDVSVFPKFQDFTVVHDYLVTPIQKMQARIDRRGQNDNWTYTHTIRCPVIHRESPELKMQVTARKYELLLAQKDSSHYTVSTTRRCFLWNNQYFQLDVYEEPCPQRCKGLILLETYTSNRAEDFKLPPFLDVQREVTGDLDYSMYNLSKKLDPELSVLSNPHDDSKDKKPETDVKRNAASELDKKVDDSASSVLTTSVLDPAVDQPEVPVVQKITSELDTKVVICSTMNGYHFDIARDQVAGSTLSKLDICDSSAILDDELEDGDVFFGDVDDYERFAKWCHSGKSGAAVK